MIATIALANTSITSHNHHFFFVVRTFMIQSLSSFEIYTTILLTIITVLCVRSPEPTRLLTAGFYPLINVSPIPLPQPYFKKTVRNVLFETVNFCSYFYLFIYLFLAALGLRCCTRAFSSCGEQGLLFVVVHGLLIVVASLVAKHGL